MILLNILLGSLFLKVESEFILIATDWINLKVAMKLLLHEVKKRMQWTPDLVPNKRWLEIKMLCNEVMLKWRYTKLIKDFFDTILNGVVVTSIILTNTIDRAF